MFSRAKNVCCEHRKKKYRAPERANCICVERRASRSRSAANSPPLSTGDRGAAPDAENDVEEDEDDEDEVEDETPPATPPAVRKPAPDGAPPPPICSERDADDEAPTEACENAVTVVPAAPMMAAVRAPPDAAAAAVNATKTKGTRSSSR